MKYKIKTGSKSMKWLGRNSLKNNIIKINPNISKSDRKFVIHHEKFERNQMKKGVSYHVAHRKATQSEKRMVIKSGKNWKNYSKRMNRILHKTLYRKKK